MHVNIIMILYFAHFTQKAKSQSMEINPVQSKNGHLIFKTGSLDLPINYEYHCLTVNHLNQANERLSLLIFDTHE